MSKIVDTNREGGGGADGSGMDVEEGASGSWYSRIVFLVRQYRYPFIPE